MLIQQKPNSLRWRRRSMQGIMILLYGAGGEPGRGGIPMSLIRSQTSDVSLVCGVQGKIAHRNENHSQ